MPTNKNKICECGRVVGAHRSGGYSICDRCWDFDNRAGQRRHSPTRYEAKSEPIGDFYNYTGAITHSTFSGGLTPLRGPGY